MDISIVDNGFKTTFCPSTLSLSAAQYTPKLSSTNQYASRMLLKKEREREKIGQKSSQTGSGGGGTFHFTLVLQHENTQKQILYY